MVHTSDLTWVRAKDVFARTGDGTYGGVQLFDDISPNDIQQMGTNSLLDCWLMSSFAAIAEFPEAVRSLFVQKEATIDGHYLVKLFDPHKKKWTKLEVDDKLPMTNESSPKGLTHLEHAYAVPKENEIWVQLLEKAWARFCSQKVTRDIPLSTSDFALLGPGWEYIGMLTLTGEMSSGWKRNSKDNWVPYAETPVQKSNGKYLDPSPPVRPGGGWGVNSREVWKILTEADNSNQCMFCTIMGQSEAVRGDGLIEGHAYTLIAAREIHSEKMGLLNLVKIRNPWGNEIEWTGDWSDKSELWQMNKDVVFHLHFKPEFEGTFWMPFEDWARIFNDFWVCHRKFTEYVSNEEFREVQEIALKRVKRMKADEMRRFIRTLNCPKNHKMKHMRKVPSTYLRKDSNNENYVVCDNCDQNDLEDNIRGFWHCDPCQFDLCLSCAKLRRRATYSKNTQKRDHSSRQLSQRSSTAKGASPNGIEPVSDTSSEFEVESSEESASEMEEKVRQSAKLRPSNPKKAEGKIKQKETLAEMESRIGFVEFQLNQLKTLTTNLRKGTTSVTRGPSSIERIPHNQTQHQHSTQRGRKFDNPPARHSTQQYQEVSPLRSTHRAMPGAYTHSLPQAAEISGASHFPEESKKPRTKYQTRSNDMDERLIRTYDRQTPRRTPRLRTYNSSTNQRRTAKPPKYFDMLVNGL